MKRWLAFLLIPAPLASADEVTLQSGQRVQGIIRKNDGRRIELEVGVGTVWFDRKEVLSTAEGRTPLHEYYERWNSVKDGSKASEFLELARFAVEHKLGKFVKPLMEKVVALDPENEEARRRLGHEKVQGRWMTKTEANRAKGLVEFEGRWMTEAEKQLIVSERLKARIRIQEEAAERRRKREAEELERERQTFEERFRRHASREEEGYWHRPSEFWPHYYRGPRRAPYYGYGGYDAVPTINIFVSVPRSQVFLASCWHAA